MLHDFIQNNYATIVGCLCLLIFILTNHLLDTENTRMFLEVICCILILVVADALELWTASWDHPTQLRVLMSAIGYSLRPVLVYIIICILQNNGGPVRQVLLVMLIVNMLCSFSALFCPLMFSYSEDNLFIRGPLGILPFIISAILLAIMLLFTIQKYQEGHYAESMIALFIVLVSLVSIACETIFHYKGLLNSSSAISVVFYYLYLLTQQLKRDQLTYLRNRHCFYLDVDKKKDHALAFVSLDINNLKAVNDTKGHAAGDKLICDVVDCIKRNLSAEACAYRMGGDEFEIISRYQQPESIDKMVQAIRKDVEAEGNSCAIGVAFYPVNGNLDQALKEADLAMYEDKRRIKKQASF